MTAVLELDLCRRQGTQVHAIRACCGPGLYQLAGPGASWLLYTLASGASGGYGTALLDGVALRCSAGVHARDGARPVVAWMQADAPPRLLTPLRWTLAPLLANGVPREAAAARARQALRRLAMLHLEHRPLWTLTAADRQRVALARTLAQVPGLLLLERPDAPFAPDERRAVFATLVCAAAEWEMVTLILPASPCDGLSVLQAG